MEDNKEILDAAYGIPTIINRDLNRVIAKTGQRRVCCVLWKLIKIHLHFCCDTVNIIYFLVLHSSHINCYTSALVFVQTSPT